MTRCRFSFILITSFSVFVCNLVMTSSASSATLVVANKAEASASLINLEDGKVIATLPTGNAPHEVGISPNGQLALVTNYGNRGNAGRSLTLIDIPTASVVKTIDLGEYLSPHGVEWLDDSRAAVTVEGSQALIVIDVTTGEVQQAIGTDQQISHMVALDPGRQRAYTTNMGSNSVTIIDLETGKRLKNIPTGKGAEGIAVTAADGHIWVTNRAEDTISVLDADALATVKHISSEGFPIRATATPGGQVLVTRARAGELVIYDSTSFDEIRTVAFDIDSMDTDERLFGDRFGDSSVPIGVVVDDKGEHAYVAHANADVITEIDLATGEVVRMLRAGKEPDGMGFSHHVSHAQQ